jgi:hypothetical protein
MRNFPITLGIWKLSREEGHALGPNEIFEASRAMKNALKYHTLPLEGILDL